MSIISTILNNESSGGHNVPQGIVDSNTAKGTPAAGYFQIIQPTWQAYGGTGKVMDSSYAQQLQVAQNIPVNQWGPKTVSDLGAAGYHPIGNETLGAMLQRYGENPTDTTPADGASPTGGPMMAHGPDPSQFDPATGLPLGTTDTPANMTNTQSSGQGGTGAPINIGLQSQTTGAIEGWINQIASSVWKGVSDPVSAFFADVQNWFVRAFVIIVGLVILAIGIIKLTGNDVSTVVVKAGELAAAA